MKRNRSSAVASGLSRTRDRSKVRTEPVKVAESDEEKGYPCTLRSAMPCHAIPYQATLSGQVGSVYAGETKDMKLFRLGWTIANWLPKKSCEWGWMVMGPPCAHARGNLLTAANKDRCLHPY